MNNTGWFSKEVISDRLTRLWEPHVHRFFRANLFHIIGKDADLVVDFGTGLGCLRGALNIQSGKPILAVATHIHVDHVGSFHEFENRLGHQDEADAFSYMNDADTLANYFRGQSEALNQAPPADILLEDYRITPAPLTQILTENCNIDIGNACYTVLHLPGHSAGSIGLLDQRTGTFFSGDAIYEGQLVDDLPGSDKNIYNNTMRRLLELDVNIVHGGHGNQFGNLRMHEIAKKYIEANF